MVSWVSSCTVHMVDMSRVGNGASLGPSGAPRNHIRDSFNKVRWTRPVEVIPTLVRHIQFEYCARSAAPSHQRARFRHVICVLIHDGIVHGVNVISELMPRITAECRLAAVKG